MNATRDTFGTRLRLERERRGITLREIANSTKIKESLFAEIERGDDSNWPQGIFRRAHMCAYLSAVGLPAQPWLREFLEVFPDDSLCAPVSQPVLDTKAAQPSAESSPQDIELRLEGRMWTALFDLAAVCLMTAAAGVLGIEGLWMIASIVALSYFTVGSACFGRSPGSFLRDAIQSRASAASVVEPARAPLSEIRLFVAERTGKRAFRRVRKPTPKDRSEVEPQRATA